MIMDSNKKKRKVPLEAYLLPLLLSSQKLLVYVDFKVVKLFFFWASTINILCVGLLDCLIDKHDIYLISVCRKFTFQLEGISGFYLKTNYAMLVSKSTIIFFLWFNSETLSRLLLLLVYLITIFRHWLSNYPYNVIR